MWHIFLISCIYLDLHKILCQISSLIKWSWAHQENNQEREKCVFIYLQQDYFVGLFPPVGGELVTLPGSAYDWGPVAAAAAPSTARLHPPAPVRNMQRVCGRWSVVALNATYIRV